MHTAHKDLKRSMQILTTSGWATVHTEPISAANGKLVVLLTNGHSEIREPGYLWLRRINHPLPTKENR